MSFLEHYKSGNLVLPSALLFHYKDIFKSSDDFLVWQFFYLQNTTKRDDLAPSQIANALGKSVADINKVISSLTSQELLDMKTIELAGEIEIIFDASPVLAKLDQLLASQTSTNSEHQTEPNHFKQLVDEFERELGRFLSPFELEDLEKSLREAKTDPDLIREALKEAVFNGKTNWKYIQAILRNWRKEGIVNLRQVEERKRAREDQNASQVNVSDDFLAAMNLWSDS
ncbi:DnaD domain-containing protein [Streptococcus dysgalactiae]|uniref:DnaD domain-containing protein n=1 Tax=Streptococcus dysgalactiae TaxID=1334 RepID=UPI000E051E2A|nr:DnaD domain-containing protein [Streptococcus dysgalactiae]MCB2830055.1 DnaD domain-containing protein [Streptococcus dysgalactiae subsp. dysgalactiae]MCB2831981.1 DnaD domain-containing protein [Streptococcus dysgalactiae subsp. dysgalactiae]MCB2835596.1 DnaD domain-containing protein [Streptococcus dysgalactiae subsp. dysgalactiae]MCB2839671.1 DnaD domain-containing protein [Streptococcus dysgalactiae subsp. dysgalactiae]MCB2843491.1 DnaD domain-containing protein [Streptococcus dysgalact